MGSRGCGGGSDGSPGFTGWQRVDGCSQGWRAGAVFSSACPTVAPKGEEGGRGQKLLSTTPLLLPMSTLGRVWGEI